MLSRALLPLCFAIVLVGYACAHVDDSDALYYRELGRAAIAEHHLFDLRWSQLPDVRFIDHLPPGIWTVGASEWVLGEHGSRLAYGAMSFASFLLLASLMQALGAAAIVGWMFALVATSESFVRQLTLQRLDPPFVLLWVLSLWIAARSRRFSASLACGMVAGLAALYRPPQAMALCLLVPLAVIAGRKERAEQLARLSDGGWLVVFGAAAAIPLACFHLLDVRYGSGVAIQDFLRAQVMASLSGARADGASSHLAPLAKLFSHFWPGMVGLLFATSALLTSEARRRMPTAVWFAWAWAGCVIVALSLGKRHVWTHSWPAYPALFVIAAWGTAQLAAIAVDRMPALRALVERMRPSFGKVALSLAAVWALAIVAFGSLECEVVKLEQKVAALGSPICPSITVASADGVPDWRIAHRLLDHLRRPLVFARVADVKPEGPPGCVQIVSLDRAITPPAALGMPLLANGRHRFWAFTR